MYLLKQEASRLLFPCPPFSILLLGSSFQKPDLYSITHGPQMLLFSFPSSMGGGAPSTEMPVLLSRLVCPNTSGRASALPQALGEYSLVQA